MLAALPPLPLPSLVCGARPGACVEGAGAEGDLREGGGQQAAGRAAPKGGHAPLRGDVELLPNPWPKAMCAVGARAPQSGDGAWEPSGSPPARCLFPSQQRPPPSPRTPLWARGLGSKPSSEWIRSECLSSGPAGSLAPAAPHQVEPMPPKEVRARGQRFSTLTYHRRLVLSPASHGVVGATLLL